MVKLNAHFDGKVIVPDEPLDLPANQKLRISVEMVETTGESEPKPPTDWQAMIGIARADGNGRPYDPADEDALWEKGPLPGSR